MTTSRHSGSIPAETRTSSPQTSSFVGESGNAPGTSTPWQSAATIIFYTPKRCRYDPANPPRFSIPMNLLFAFAASFTVANLYYNHPILHLLAEEFDVSNERASLIPTLAQAGYASGLLFLCPLGDVFPRRSYVLSLVLFTATAWYVKTVLYNVDCRLSMKIVNRLGLCLTDSFAVFCFLTLLTSLTTVTPQLSMLPRFRHSAYTTC